MKNIKKITISSINLVESVSAKEKKRNVSQSNKKKLSKEANYLIAFK
jgi:hypothetical protein